MVSNQHNQFCVSGVSEHPVEAAHVVLPVLQTEQQERFLYQAFNKENSPGRLMRVNGISEGHPAAPIGD